MSSTPFRAMIAGLASMPPVVLRGQEYSGAYLATLVAIDPEQPEQEAANTPRIISELGRLVAAAYRDKEMAEVDYRVWREKTTWRLQNSEVAAKKAKFACLVNPGLDAKGNEKPTKMPSRTDVDSYVRHRPEYREFYDAKLLAEEVWATLHAAFEAAKARTWAIKGWERSTGAEQTPRIHHEEPDDGTTRHPGHSEHGSKPEVSETESLAVTRARTPIPPPASRAGGPPPPPSRR